MADTKITGLTALGAKPADTDVLVVVDDPGGTPVTKKVTYANLVSGLANHAVCQGRLTLTTATPITVADVTAATTLYFTPYKGDLIGLYDGSAWAVQAFTERSIAIPATTDTNYDVFLYDNSGTLTLELTAWTNDTTRATALVAQNGVLVKTGATTRRYLGTIRTTDSSGEVDDSVARRFVWNYYNRVRRDAYVTDQTQHTYATNTWRYYNNDSTNIFEVLCGVVEDNWLLSVQSWIYQDSSGSIAAGLDWTSGAPPGMPNGALLWINNAALSTSGVSVTIAAQLGYHYYSLLENSQDAATVTIEKGHALLTMFG